jgi:hypothetical protein
VEGDGRSEGLLIPHVDNDLLTVESHVQAVTVVLNRQAIQRPGTEFLFTGSDTQRVGIDIDIENRIHYIGGGRNLKRTFIRSHQCVVGRSPSRL